MRIIQVLPFAGDESSGPSYSVPKLCTALGKAGAEVEFHVLRPNLRSPENYKLYTYARHLIPHPRFGRSPEMLAGLKEASRRADIVHTSSLWMAPNIYPASACENTSAKLVFSPRGTLAPWAWKRSRFRKWLTWNFAGQKKVVEDACLLHATSQKEYEEIRTFGLEQPVAIIPIGIELPHKITPRELWSTGRRKKLLFQGRIHPVKGVDNLLKVWKQLEDDFEDWDLVVAGPSLVDYLRSIRELAQQLNIKRVSFPGEIHGQDKFVSMASADLYILPSHTENFGVTVAEALSCGTPVLTTVGTPWSGLIEHHAGWWVKDDLDVICQQLRKCLSMHENELLKCGENGKVWMKEEFNWENIGRRMLDSYRWLLDGGTTPEWINED